MRENKEKASEGERRERTSQTHLSNIRDFDVLDGDLAVLGWRSIENRMEIQGLLLGAKGNWKGFKQKNICV